MFEYWAAEPDSKKCAAEAIKRIRRYRDEMRRTGRAKRAFILLQFLIESVVLSLVGGILGLGFIFIGTLLASGIFDFDIGLTWYNIGLALLISTIIGLISGIVPSLMASRLDPVEAMRYS